MYIRLLGYVPNYMNKLHLTEFCFSSANAAPPLWSSGQFLAAERRCIVLPVGYELSLYMLCRRK
jgi:hypothetical protein